MFDAAERSALESARVGRLATADRDGRPHVVPICFVLVERDDGELRFVTPIDEKPKSAPPARLRRVRNIEANPRVAVVVDHYAENWNRLAWIQLRGTAAVVEPGGPGHAAAVAALRAKYDQYADHALEDRPVIAVTPGSARSWGDLTAFTE